MEKREAYNAYNYGRATFVDPPLIGEKAENNLFGKFFTIYEQKDPHHVIIPGLIAANVQGGYLPPYDCAVYSDEHQKFIGGLSTRYSLNSASVSKFQKGSRLLWTNEAGDKAYKRTAGSAKCPLVTGSLDSMLPCSYLEKVDAPAEDDHVFAHSYCSSKELRPWTDDERRQIVAIPCTCLADFVTWRPPYAHCPDVRFVDKSVRNAERDPPRGMDSQNQAKEALSQGSFYRRRKVSPTPLKKCRLIQRRDDLF